SLLFMPRGSHPTGLGLDLGLPDLVDLGPADGAGPGGGGLTVLHRDRLRVLHLPLGLALEAVAFSHFLCLPYLVDLGATNRTRTCGRRLAVLHGDRLGVADLALLFALEAVSDCHVEPSFVGDGLSGSSVIAARGSARVSSPIRS